MKLRDLGALVAAALCATAPAAAAQAEAAKPKIVILGVSHSAQLVAHKDSAGALNLFMDAVKPDAICIERPPEEAARGDYYEFTYEVQGIVVPYAATHRLPLCPFDWVPSLEDQKLAFGVNLDEPPEIRPASGFQGFLSFDDAETARDIFWAEAPEHLQTYRDFAAKPAPAGRDFARRLYLYRTFLQAQRIKAAAHARGRSTILVVVGEFHKHDLEATLGADPGVELKPASSYPRPDAEAADKAMSHEQRVAVLSFNLLGRQAETRRIDWAWIDQLLAALPADSPEARLFRLRTADLRGKLPPPDAAKAYDALGAQVPADAAFAWTGVKYGSRLDSYFDPFGNLTVAQRAQLEAARAWLRAGQTALVAQRLEALARQLSPRKLVQLRAHWANIVVPASGPPAKS